MLKVHRMGEVERVEVGTEANGKVIFTTSSYAYSGLVFDSVCSNARGEVREYLMEKPCESVYLTHYREDHSGNAILFDTIHAGGIRHFHEK